jgi:hypothetical protein
MEDRLLEALGRQGQGGGQPRSAVCLSEVRDALGTQRDAPLHAWANDFCRRHALTVMLLGDRMYFSPRERGN